MKQLPDMVIHAFDLEPIAQTHRVGKLRPSIEERYKLYTGADGRFKSQFSFLNDEYEFEILITLKYDKDSITAAVDLIAYTDVDETEFNKAVYFGIPAKRPRVVREADLEWSKSETKSVPRDIVQTAYRLIDEYLGSDGGEEDDDFEPEPKPDIYVDEPVDELSREPVYVRRR